MKPFGILNTINTISMRTVYLRNIILVTAVFFFHAVSSGQEVITIKGVVTAFENCALNHVTVRSSKTGTQVLSDSIGRFSIGCADKDILIFSAAGFIDRKVKIKEAKEMYVNLNYGYSGNSFDEAVKNGHITAASLELMLSKYPNKGQKDYSGYQDIYEIIRSEFGTLSVEGTTVNNKKSSSVSMSAQVLYEVNGMVVNDISYIVPSEVQKIEFVEYSDATAYGMRGANGVLKITLKDR
jgi:hypothetical protein